jgi:hypothetical protein
VFATTQTGNEARKDREMRSMLIPVSEDYDEDDEELLVHEWRAEQLERLGLPGALAHHFADLVDWHQIADLVWGGCAPELALEIAR